PAELKRILSNVVEATSDREVHGDAGDTPAGVEDLPWVAARVGFDMNAYYDPKEGGWGRGQKSPLGANAQGGLPRSAPTPTRRHRGPRTLGMQPEAGARTDRPRAGRRLPVLVRKGLPPPPLREAHDLPGREPRGLRRRVRCDEGPRAPRCGEPHRNLHEHVSF